MVLRQVSLHFAGERVALLQRWTNGLAPLKPGVCALSREHLETSPVVRVTSLARLEALTMVRSARGTFTASNRGDGEACRPAGARSGRATTAMASSGDWSQVAAAAVERRRKLFTFVLLHPGSMWERGQARAARKPRV